MTGKSTPYSTLHQLFNQTFKTIQTTGSTMKKFMYGKKFKNIRVMCYKLSNYQPKTKTRTSNNIYKAQKSLCIHLYVCFW